jgi:hypothetical protein
MRADRKRTHRRNKVNVRLSIVPVIRFEMMIKNRCKSQKKKTNKIVAMSEKEGAIQNKTVKLIKN